MFILNLRKHREETLLAQATRRKVEAETRQMELDLQTRSLGQILCIYAETVKKEKRNNNIIFSDAELRHALGKDGLRIHAVLESLRKEGRAKKEPLSGWWSID